MRGLHFLRNVWKVFCPKSTEKSVVLKRVRHEVDIKISFNWCNSYALDKSINIISILVYFSLWFRSKRRQGHCWRWPSPSWRCCSGSAWPSASGCRASTRPTCRTHRLACLRKRNRMKIVSDRQEKPDSDPNFKKLI